MQHYSYLGEGDWVESVLAGNLKTDLVSALGVPGSLSTGLNLGVDLVVVCSSKDAQVVGGSDRSGVLASRVSNSSGVVGNSSLLDIVTSRSTSQETVLSNDCVNVGSWTLEEIEESTTVEVGLLEVEVELGTVGLGCWEERTQDLSLETFRDGVVELDLCVKSVDSVPCLSKLQAWVSIYQHKCFGTEANS